MSARAQRFGVRRHRAAVAIFVVCVTSADRPAAAQLCPPLICESVRISVPVTVAFSVPNMSQPASSGPTTVTFDQAQLFLFRAVRISVKADDDLRVSSGEIIAASRVSWSTSSVSNGVGTNGTLSKTSYAQVFQGNTGSTSGGLTLQWTLAAGTIPEAGTYQTTLRWKIESVSP